MTADVQLRQALVTEPLSAVVDGLAGGKAFSLYRNTCGGVASSVGATLLVEQRFLQTHLGLGDFIKKRKKERSSGVLKNLIDTFQLDDGHFSDPVVHMHDSTNTMLMSWPLVIVWLIDMRKNYVKASFTHLRGPWRD